jgi:hypothetical protein
MSSFMKFVVLLLTVLLSLSIGRDSYGELLRVKAQEPVEEGAHSYISGSKLYKNFALHPVGEIIVNGINSLPAPNSVKNPDNFFGSAASFELSLQHVATQYLLHAKKISRSLTVRDIIFPFHYFW